MLFWSSLGKRYCRTNSCGILASSWLRFAVGVQIWDGNNLKNLGNPIGSGSCLGQGLENGIASTNSCGILRTSLLIDLNLTCLGSRREKAKWQQLRRPSVVLFNIFLALRALLVVGSSPHPFSTAAMSYFMQALSKSEFKGKDWLGSSWARMHAYRSRRQATREVFSAVSACVFSRALVKFSQLKGSLYVASASHLS